MPSTRSSTSTTAGCSQNTSPPLRMKGEPQTIGFTVKRRWPRVCQALFCWPTTVSRMGSQAARMASTVSGEMIRGRWA